MLKQLNSFNNKYPVYVMVDNTVDEEHKNELLKYNIDIINIEPYKSIFNVYNKENDSYPSIVLSKLMIPFIDELKDYEKILYMDSDIQIVRDFSNIFNIDIGRNEIQGVLDFNLQTSMKSYINRLREQIINITNINPSKKYINTGVLIFNNRLLRNLNVDLLKQKITYFIKLHYMVRFDYADQDIINLCFKIGFIPYFYNVLYKFQPRTENDVFIHHIAKPKIDFDKLILDK